MPDPEIAALEEEIARVDQQTEEAQRALAVLKEQQLELDSEETKITQKSKKRCRKCRQRGHRPHDCKNVPARILKGLEELTGRSCSQKTNKRDVQEILKELKEIGNLIPPPPVDQSNTFAFQDLLEQVENIQK